MNFKYPTALIVFLFLMVSVVFAQNDTPRGVLADSLQLLDYDSLLTKVNDAQISFHTISIRAKLGWDDGNSQQDFLANIRMLKDSIIWMSLTGAMGIKGMRLLITPDSVRIINKMANEFAVRDFGFISTWLLFPLNFKTMQELIAGDKIDLGEKVHLAVARDSADVLYAETDKMLEKVWVDKQSYTITEMLLKDKLITQEMTATFGSYNTPPEGQGKSFSYNRVIDIKRDGLSLKLTIEVSKIKLNENLTYPFEVSAKYKRIE